MHPVHRFSDAITEESAHQAGADAFLLKPKTPELLQKTVSQLIAIGRANPRSPHEAGAG